ncbi:MAG: DsbA family protein [Candidatus Aenigmatarchaeota archaeon]
MEKEIEELQYELSNLKEKFMKGEIEADEFREQENLIKEEIKKEEERIEKDKITEHEEKEYVHKLHKNKKHGYDRFIWPTIAVITIVLFAVSMITGGFGIANRSTSGAQSLSLQEASVKASDYLNALMQGQAAVRIIDIKDAGNLYNFKIDIGGQIYDSYMTKDGKLLFPSSVDLSKALKPTQNSPQKTDVSADDDPYIGSENAKVIIVEFSDYQCPYCGKVEPAVKQIIQTYGDKIKFVYRDFPLSFHENSEKAAEASECADEQGKFWQYHDKLFENQNSLNVNNLKEYAKELGLNETKFNECLDSGKYAEEVKKDLQDGTKYGVSGTPAFFINGRLLSGAQPFSAFKQIIDEELAK